MPLKIFALKQAPDNGQDLKQVLEGVGHQVDVSTCGRLVARVSAGEKYDVLVGVLNFSEDLVFDFLTVAKTNSNLEKIPFVFCAIQPMDPTVAWLDRVEAAAKSMAADYVIFLVDFYDRQLPMLLQEIEERIARGV